MQFILHEKLARLAELDPAALTEVGKTTVLARFSSKRAAASGRQNPNEVVVPPLEAYLAKDGHVDPGADAQVTEVLSSELGGHVAELLSSSASTRTRSARCRGR